MKITMEHVRQVKGLSKGTGFCSRGTRHWFKLHNLDYSDFLKNGIDEEIMLATGDALAKIVVEQAHGR